MRRCRSAHLISQAHNDTGGPLLRFIGLDIHRDFCEVAISEGGPARSAGRAQSDPERLELCPESRAERSSGTRVDRQRARESLRQHVLLLSVGNRPGLDEG